MERRKSIVEAAMNKLSGANMDIDLVTPANQISWHQEKCPWNALESSVRHHCAVKNISICPYFCGVEYLDTLLCCYPDKNPYQTQS
jgi:hypothetical protein